MNSFTAEQQGQLTALCQTIAENVQRFMRERSNRESFEAWYLKRYGVPYVWRKKA